MAIRGLHPLEDNMPRDKVILAYSGGLDTSVMVPWLGEKYNLDVVAFTVDLGQGEDIHKIKQKAIRTGAVDAVALDARNLFVDRFVWPSPTAAPARAMTRCAST